VGEYQSRIATEVRKDAFKVGVLGDIFPYHFTKHSILSHEDFGFPAQGLTDHLKLLASNMIGVDKKEFGILAEQCFETRPELDFPANFRCRSYSH